jgi:hypothetical protein
MPIDAFRYQPGLESQQEFARAFLASSDFTVNELRSICRAIGITNAGKRTDNIDNIITFMGLSEDNALYTSIKILSELVSRKKIWFTFLPNSSFVYPEADKLCDARELVFMEGTEKWYGPIPNPRDTNALWFIYPKFTTDWDVPEGHVNAQEFKVRWLAYGRVTDRCISVHWRGFSHLEHSDEHSDERSHTRRRTQYMYWQHVPDLIQSLVEYVQGKTLTLTLNDLVYHKLWEKYRDKEGYEWVDHRIRAETRGISLNARTKGVLDMVIANETKGLGRLANTIRRAVQNELMNEGLQIPDPDHLDKTILGTIVRELGALSYEFRLDGPDGSTLFHGHNYFGLKPNFPTVDNFPHVRVHITNLDDLEQLHFLVDHIGMHRDYGGPQQLPMFE